MTKRELTQEMRKWSNILELGYYELYFRYLTEEEAKKHWGLCIPEGTKKRTIAILNPRDKAWLKHNRTPIEILVHELLHVKGSREEDFVDTISCLLVSMNKGE